MRKPCEFRQREQPVQRPWGKTVPTVLKQQLEGAEQGAGGEGGIGKSDRAGDREDSEDPDMGL